MTATYFTRNRSHALAMGGIVAVTGALLLSTLPAPASADDYPPCTATRTDQCTQSQHHAAKSSAHHSHHHAAKSTKKAPAQ
ncbi:hypothetical protein WBP06_22070 [Novosphingobium sp. BL-8H]|uniref:hypothetical protein n=1 Tax=Novosphingobium sp. BL-8H TaxID=3127640 RepID=UPI003756B109